MNGGGKVSKEAIAEAVGLAAQAFSDYADQYIIELEPA
jgi:hypothetical protein